MADIIDLKFAKLISDLDYFIETNSIPSGFLDGTYSDHTLKSYRASLDELYQCAIDKISDRIKKQTCNKINKLRQQLKKDYIDVMNNLATTDQKFMFPTVLHKYRFGINPVRAIHYDATQMIRHFDRDNPEHLWLADLLTDPNFNKSVIDALNQDLADLNKIIEKYYGHSNLTSSTKNLPVELFHAVYTTEDFLSYRKFFDEIRDWRPDDLG